MLFCIHADDRTLQRFFTLVVISGALITQSQPFLYGSSITRLGFFSTSWLTEIRTPSTGDSRSKLRPSRLTVHSFCP